MFLAPPPRDRHSLYERAVQDPTSTLDLLEDALARSGRSAKRLREDFCGTALLATSWVTADPQRSAVGVDHDRAVLDWARTFRLPALGDAARRLRLVEADVLDGPRGAFDAVMALNFSYLTFQTRPTLKAYLARTRSSLAPGGVLMLDLFGGWLAQQGLVERRELGRGVTYVWEQQPLEPITHRVHCSIHFEAAGRRLPKPFLYDWRLWTLPELRELLAEAGFEEPEVLWDVAPRGAPPRYQLRRYATNERAWVAYLFARRPRTRA